MTFASYLYTIARGVEEDFTASIEVDAATEAEQVCEYLLGEANNGEYFTLHHLRRRFRTDKKDQVYADKVCDYLRLKGLSVSYHETDHSIFVCWNRT